MRRLTPIVIGLLLLIGMWFPHSVRATSCSVAPTPKRAVIVIHGWNSSASAMGFSLAPEKRGILSPTGVSGSGIAQTLVDCMGYSPGSTLFVFQYTHDQHWLLSAEELADALKGRFTDIDIIAHSQGGLVAKAWAEYWGNGEGQPHLHTLVTLGTPLYGGSFAGVGREFFDGDPPMFSSDHVRQYSDEFKAIDSVYRSVWDRSIKQDWFNVYNFRAPATLDGVDNAWMFDNLSTSSTKTYKHVGIAGVSYQSKKVLGVDLNTLVNIKSSVDKRSGTIEDGSSVHLSSIISELKDENSFANKIRNLNLSPSSVGSVGDGIVSIGSALGYRYLEDGTLERAYPLDKRYIAWGVKHEDLTDDERVAAIVADELAQNTPIVHVDRSIINLPVSPVIVNDRTFIPVRKVAGILQAQVTWENGQVAVSKGTSKVTFNVGEPGYWIDRNGHKSFLGDWPAAFMSNPPAMPGTSYAMIPMRLFVEAFGWSIGYDSESSAIWVDGT